MRHSRGSRSFSGVRDGGERRLQQPSHSPTAANRSRINGPVPQLDFNQAEFPLRNEGVNARRYNEMVDVIDTTRSQHLANCSDCMLPCRVFLGLAQPPPSLSKRPDSAYRSRPLVRPAPLDAGEALRPGRSHSVARPVLPIRSVSRSHAHADSVRGGDSGVSLPPHPRFVQQRSGSMDPHVSTHLRQKGYFLQPGQNTHPSHSAAPQTRTVAGDERATMGAPLGALPGQLYLPQGPVAAPLTLFGMPYTLQAPPLNVRRATRNIFFIIRACSWCPYQHRLCRCIPWTSTAFM